MASPRQHHPSKEGGQSHLCSLELGPHPVPSQLKEVTCRVAVGTSRCGTVGGKGWKSSPGQHPGHLDTK